MRYSGSFSLLTGLIAGLALLFAPQSGQAQEGKKVRFKTGDGVELVGTFFAGGKGDACALLLHDLGKGKSSHNGGWDELAKALQKKGYSVLSFDFRGHGDSTTVDAKFWANRVNVALVKHGKAASDQISVKHFKPNYYPFLVNDIAAAKSYLDRQNDAGACNSSALVVIGAGKGATLGAIWMNSEWHRYKILPPDPQMPVLHYNSEPEGTGTIAAVWLNISPTVGKQAVSLASVLGVSARRGVPMLFLYGEGDKKGEKEAKSLTKALSTGPGKIDKHTGPFAIPKAAGASGEGLLKKSLGTNDAIVTWVADVLQSKTPEQVNREFVKSLYVWGTPGPRGLFVPARALPAKPSGEMVIQWRDYEPFMR
jgi:hypothetical protein